MGLTETWLSPDHKDAELEINGYTLHRKDRDRDKPRQGRYSGGVAIYIRDDISPLFKPLLEFSNGVNEGLLLYSSNLNIIIGVIYRQPTNPYHKSDAPEFLELVSSMVSKIETVRGCCPDLYICGDFNIPHTLSNHQYKPTVSCNRSLLKILDELSLQFNLSQIVHKPTHINGNILDFLLTNNQDTIFNYHITPTIHSDHFNIEVATHLSFNKTKTTSTEKSYNNKFEKFNFYSDKIDWENISKNLDDIDWDSVLNPYNFNPEKQYDLFIEKCIDIITASNTPLRKLSKKKIIPRDRRILMRKRKKLKKRRPSRTTKEKLFDIEVKLQNSYANERINQELDAISKIKANPKFFYSYAKRFSKTKPKVGPLIDPSTNRLTDDNLEMANLLQEQYKSVFTPPKPQYNHPDVDPTIVTESIDNIDFTEEDFIREIQTLSPNSAAGPDGFPAIFLLKNKTQLAKPLNLIWHNILDKGFTPKILKTSYISPIFKKGNQGLPENYRPVALTSHVTKIFEKIVRKNLQDHLERNNLYNNNQHGFRSGRSCLSQLLAHTERLIQHIEQGHNVDVIYLDFSKAFDRVDHSILLNKLERNGVSGKLHSWIKSFLTGRTQRVSVNTTLSISADVVSGVPQGSVLGALLFLVMIQDIDEEIYHAVLSSFADDTRLMKEVSSQNDVQLLQNDLHSVYNWSDTNNMQLNGLKFEHMCYGKNEELKSQSVYFSDTQNPIETKNQVKDLGVTLDVDMTYDQHIQNQINKVKAISSWIYRTFKTRDPDVMLTLWKSLAIPHLDYCSQLWSPSKRCSIQQLENLQKSFLNGIPSMKHLNYWEKLKKLKIYSLERRRERYRVIYTWCILENIVPNFNYNNEQGGVHSYTNQRLGRKCHLKAVNVRHKNVWRDCLSQEGPRLFNVLPKSILQTALNKLLNNT